MACGGTSAVVYLVLAAAVTSDACGPLKKPDGGTDGPDTNGVPAKFQQALQSALGGTTDINGLLGGPDKSGNKLIARPSELSCSDWGGECKWRNEPQSAGVDALDWASAKGQWDTTRGNVAFGTAAKPQGSWAVTGNPSKMEPDEGAMLVSDPIPCQPGDGELEFKYWTTPGATVRVCTRKPNDRDDYMFCSPSIGSGDPGPTVVNIRGPINEPFELVLESKGFTYDNFGVQGGAVILDDIVYKAGDFAGKCILRPDGNGDGGADGGDGDGDGDGTRPRPRPRLTACETITCDFDSGPCLDQLVPGGGWRIQQGDFGNRHTGVREELDGSYAVARGPRAAKLGTGPFRLDNDEMVGFCFYRPGALSELNVLATQNGQEDRIYKSPAFDASNLQHEWKCERILLARGEYDKLEFVADGLLNDFTYLGLDQIQLFSIQSPDTPKC